MSRHPGRRLAAPSRGVQARPITPPLPDKALSGRLGAPGEGRHDAPPSGARITPPSYRTELSVPSSPHSTAALALLDRVEDTVATPMTRTDPRIVLTVAEAADRLGIGRTLMYSLVSSGAVESVTIGRLRRIPADALTVYVDSLRAARPGGGAAA